MKDAEQTQIIFPPQFEPFQTYLSGPYLKGLISKASIAATVVDANIDFYDWLISLSNGSDGVDTESMRYLRGQVLHARCILKSRPTTLGDYRWAVNVMDEYLRGISPRGVQIGLTQLRVGNRYSSSDLEEHLRVEGNIFQRYFEFAEGRLLGRRSVSTYLLSLVVIDQLAAAITFAKEIKRRRPTARVLIGGPLVSRLHQSLLSIPWIATSFDAIAPGEAYRLLPKLLGLSSFFTGHVTPDFSDLNLNQYWSPERVLPYLVGHGCKWGKCTFCSHHLTYDGYRASSIVDVLRDLEFLSARHDSRYISFCDEYLTPEQLNELADGLLAHKIDIRWSTFARPEAKFRDKEFVQKLRTAGCRMLMFGLESGSQRVLQTMKKGTRVADFRLILEACKEAGIAIRYDFMVGFPGETEEEAQLTYEFIRQNRDVVDTPFSSYSVAIFELRSGIPVMDQTVRFSVLPRSPLRGDLDDQYEFDTVGGLTKESRLKWRERLIRLSKTEMDAELICPQNKTHQLVLKDLYDQDIVQLPVLRIDPTLLCKLNGRFAKGVEVTSLGNVLRVTNRANGGELELSLDLVEVMKSLARGAPLDVMFRSQRVWSDQVFSRFVDFLYRNDYVTVEFRELMQKQHHLDRTAIGAVS